MSQENWDKRWMDAAIQKGSWSKDRSRKVGAVIIDGDNVEVSNGWNGFPRNINDDIDVRHHRPAKYLWTEHSERNAIYNAARKGRATEGCKIYQSMYPCAHCARALIQSGITEVITVEPDWNDPTYSEEFAVTREMLAEAGIKVRFVEGVTLMQAKENTISEPLKGKWLPLSNDQIIDPVQKVFLFIGKLHTWIIRIFCFVGAVFIIGSVITKFIHFPEWMFGAGVVLLFIAFLISHME